jgi:hypothetical protein
VKRVVVTATMASVCGSQRDANREHLWSEADKNDALCVFKVEDGSRGQGVGARRGAPEVHLAGLSMTDTAGQRYLVCSKDQYSTLELAEMAATAGAAGVDLAAWKADEGVQKMVPKKPSTDNRKVGALLGRELVAPETSVQLAFATLKPGGHL